jgi:hypothetical protein
MSRPSPIRAFVRIIPIMAVLAATPRSGAAQPTDSAIRLVTSPTLTKFVIGDSLRFYRLRYEQNESRHWYFGATGAVLIAVGVVAAIPRPCKKPYCTVRPPAAVNEPLVGVGATLYLTGLVFKFRAAEAGARASWWHDASLAR